MDECKHADVEPSGVIEHRLTYKCLACSMLLRARPDQDGKRVFVPAVQVLV